MSYLQSIFIYIPAVAIGFMLIHLLLPERGLFALLFKFFLGIGAGLGLTSLLYFIILLVMPAGFPFLTLQIVILLILLFLTIRRERNISSRSEAEQTPHVAHYLSLITYYSLLASFLITLASFINFSIRRDQGAFDAWMIYNRAARFIYRDPTNWQATLSPDLSWGFHADYPLLVSSNVAWAWNSLGAENIRVPLIQSGLFLFACIGLLFTSLAKIKDVWKASLAAIILMSISGFVRSGSGQTADVPLAFFMLASVAAMSLRGHSPKRSPITEDDQTSSFDYAQDENVRAERSRSASPGKAALPNSDILIILSGFMAGLAGWTKNEGLLFIAVSVFVLFIIFLREKFLRQFPCYLLGLAFPVLVILYFKSIAPSGDLLSGSPTDILARVTDPARYLLILKSLGNELLSFGGWSIPLFLFIILLFFIFGSKLETEAKQLFRTLSAIIALQLLGYLAIYLITPHDLAWQLGTALDRNVLQIFPSFLFLFFFSLEDHLNGEPHASRY